MNTSKARRRKRKPKSISKGRNTSRHFCRQLRSFNCRWRSCLSIRWSLSSMSEDCRSSWAVSRFLREYCSYTQKTKTLSFFILNLLSYFLFQPVLHDWCNKGCGMCYPVCGMVHIKEPMLLIGKSSLCGGSGFPLSLSEWSLTICLMPYNRI